MVYQNDYFFKGEFKEKISSFLGELIVPSEKVIEDKVGKKVEEIMEEIVEEESLINSFTGVIT